MKQGRLKQEVLLVLTKFFLNDFLIILDRRITNVSSRLTVKLFMLVSQLEFYK